MRYEGPQAQTHTTHSKTPKKEKEGRYRSGKKGKHHPLSPHTHKGQGSTKVLEGWW